VIKLGDDFCRRCVPLEVTRGPEECSTTKSQVDQVLRIHTVCETSRNVFQVKEYSLAGSLFPGLCREHRRLEKVSA
jgi:hypothetical protein